MKKLLLLLLLFFFSTQGFAALCPDGSLPTRTISMDGSYYVSKCDNTGNNYKKSNSYGPRRLFDFDTRWTLSNGTLFGNNGIVCHSFSEYIGICNNGVNYYRCGAGLCGSDGTSYSFPNSTCIRSSFGSYCCNDGRGTHSATCQ